MPSPSPTSDEGPNEDMAQELGTPEYRRLWEGGAILRRHKERSLASKFWTSDSAPRYTALPPHTIRLLSIKPGSEKEVLECSLRVTDLMRDAPTYTALSYSWTKDSSWKDGFWEGLLQETPLGQTATNVLKHRYQDEIIICDGNVIKVTQSLYDALLQLRNGRPQDSEYWIDALCINQKDEEEKSLQVQMMGHIYHEAELVLVWLGTVPLGLSRRHPYLDRTLPQLLLLLSEHFDEDAGENSRKSTIWKHSESVQALFALVKSTNSKHSESVQALFAFFHLLSRRYFRRLWVVQETALAKKVLFLLGEQAFGSETFFKVVEFINSPRFPHIKARWHLGWQVRAHFPRWTAHFASMPLPHPSQTADTNRTGTWSLHKWLETCMGRKASDDRDIVFAGLSLVQPDLLQIRRSLLLSEASRPPLPPRPPPPSWSPVRADLTPLPPRSGVQAVAPSHQSPAHGSGDVELWPQLKADYSISRREVLLNLAACVLSGPDPTALLSISSRYRARAFSGSSSGYNPSLAPSWVPALAPWSTIQQKVKCLGDYGVDCSAATKVQNDFRISSDGSTLLLSATRLGNVQKRFVPPGIGNHASTTRQEYIGEPTLELMKEISTLPSIYRDTDQSYPAALVSASTWGLHGWNQLASRDAILGFCLALDKDFNDTMADRFLMDDPLNAPMYALPRWALKLKLPGAYDTLKKAHPDVPWSKSVTQTTNSEEDRRLREQYLSSCRLDLTRTQRLFTTDTGYIGQTMTGVEIGDEVVLVHGSSVPYIFRRVDKAIRAEIEVLRHELRPCLFTNTDMQDRQKWSEWMQSLEGELGKRDGWIVVGEAYVEGVMNGEAVGECFKRVERFSLV